MLEFGLTGGIGSGKSTVSALLRERGALIIDADALVRDLQRPGELVFDAMVAQWGDTIVQDDGTLDRAAVAAIVFSDSDELDRLNGIVHPAVAAETTRRLDEITDPRAVVVSSSTRPKRSRSNGWLRREAWMPLTSKLACRPKRAAMIVARSPTS